MRIDRTPGRAAPHLEWRVRLLGIGAVLALAGMWLDHTWMLNVAIVILLVGFALRFLPPRGGREEAADEGPDGDDAEAAPRRG